MNQQTVTYSGSSLSLKEPIAWEGELPNLEELKPEPTYIHSAALTAASLLWAFTIADRSQGFQPVTTGSTFYFPVQPALSANKRNRVGKVVRLLSEWIADTSGYDEETWPKLKKALDEDRLSSRKLFNE